MRKRPHFLLIFSALICLLVSTAQAKSPVWKVSKGEQFLFIGGTIHMLSKKDYPLPKGFELAFQLSEDLVFETDIDGVNSVSTQMKFLPVLMYQDERTLESTLKKSTYTQLTNYLKARNLPISMFNKFTPAGLNTSLVVMELQNMGISSEGGVESHFNQRAKAAQKDVAWLESIEQQVALFDRMNALDADMVVTQTLRDVAKLEQEWPRLLAAWRTGNLAEIMQLGLAEMLNETPELYQFMLAERNQNWLPKIKQQLATPEIEFVLVGALHLAGQDSVLKMLIEEGYQVKQLD